VQLLYVVYMGVTYRKVCANTMFRDVEEADSIRGLWKDGWDCGYFTPVSLLRMANIVNTKKYRYLELKKREIRVRRGGQEAAVTGGYKIP
jgi:hypothetical protein